MTFHLGPAGVVAGAILAHKLAIALVLLGVAVHLTMAPSSPRSARRCAP